MKEKTYIELDIQDSIMTALNNLEIYPYSVIFTYCINPNGLLAITFYLPDDIDYFLKKINYNSQCDQSGYFILKETNTIIITGMSLLNFLNNDSTGIII